MSQSEPLKQEEQGIYGTGLSESGDSSVETSELTGCRAHGVMLHQHLQNLPAPIVGTKGRLHARHPWIGRARSSFALLVDASFIHTRLSKFNGTGNLAIFALPLRMLLASLACAAMDGYKLNLGDEASMASNTLDKLARSAPPICSTI
ncbi:hypothetical protein BGZ61DRAFT_523795 [Ilyonectria robusta]|uniref:uncharacterized protein n=1 Tax=Ilyonectria robusta TaxID=1079257 RepID=UPI001E8E65CD|nr:uncharacterized protein BGZ61DRAFT_523795 [Ilyonectria robusta]KAH8657268.1 hypothetical protein BGZ61DRAFT_523795 [Ilyonectria robusta]